MKRKEFDFSTVCSVEEAPKLYPMVTYRKQFLFKDNKSNNSIRFNKNKTDIIKIFDKAFIGWLPSVFLNILNKKFDFVIASTPSFTNVFIAYLYSKIKKNTKLIIEYRDLYCFNPLYKTAKNIDKVKKIELKILKHAFSVIVTTESMKKILSNFIDPDKISVIKNHMSTEDKAACDGLEKIQFDPKYYHIGYVGTLNTGRDPSTIINLGKTTIDEKPVMLHFVGTNKNEDEYIKKTAIENAIPPENIVCYGTVSRLDSLQFMKSFDSVLLIINKNASISDGYGIPGKLYDYIQTNNSIISDYETLNNIKNDFDVEISQNMGSFIKYKINNDKLLDDIVNDFIERILQKS